MKATEFEYRHQALVHQFIVCSAFLTYFIDRDDIIWRFVRDSAAPHRLERSLFILATLFIAAGAGICTWARAYHRSTSTGHDFLRHPLALGDLLYAIGLGSLAPLSGFLVLVGGEAFRVFRLIRRAEHYAQNVGAPLSPFPAANERRLQWQSAFRHEAVKWAILLTMIIFAMTLKDRLAEVLAIASLLVGLLFNAPILSSRKSDAF
jgi:hypothetical protein